MALGQRNTTFISDGWQIISTAGLYTTCPSRAHCKSKTCSTEIAWRTRCWWWWESKPSGSTRRCWEVQCRILSNILSHKLSGVLSTVVCGLYWSQGPGIKEYCTVLYCTVLYCTVLYCTVLYCTVLYCTVLYIVPRHGGALVTESRSISGRSKNWVFHSPVLPVLYCTVEYLIVQYCTVQY